MKPHRTSINLPGVGHVSAPIPSAARVGNILISSAINGKDTLTGTLPENPAAQVTNAFATMEALLSAADADLGDVAKLSIYLAHDDFRPLINPDWLARFPDPESRPARHIQIQPLAHGMVVQIEVLAVLKGDK